ncbi:hypothetical protein T310_3997 [Rasamsonia emersonii CBS 393.64]|uniref:Uncharacterized protein n=1 Tax=Rasamsonia emersonii (strain ATCC 16479 / CBS 393.64 / IMI 116815) TaxID=1408163 RepID=A0A0F4YVV5_RASE3|nr:hypothetical protein T310_3997 [Rasamsonia emersonii CBS 393.64]KKA21986.1 hypothetical protein T310_3997 [Rasamsonia emersonii CBS 393.64]
MKIRLYQRHIKGLTLVLSWSWILLRREVRSQHLRLNSSDVDSDDYNLLDTMSLSQGCAPQAEGSNGSNDVTNFSQYIPRLACVDEKGLRDLITSPSKLRQ